MGEKLVFGGKQYYMLDLLGLSSAQYGRVDGFAHIPWELKSLFGLLSDTVPIAGYHRGPYMLLAGVLGALSLTALATMDPSSISNSAAAGLFLLTNLNFALPDVIVDATVAERSKVRPELGASLQALCWGSLGLLGLPTGIAAGYLLDAHGPRLLFGLAISSAMVVTLPPLCGWLGEKPRPGAACSAAQYRTLCTDVWGHPVKRVVAAAASLVACYSVLLGMLQLTIGQTDPETADTITLIGNPLMVLGLYQLLCRVDPCLAKAAAFTFLSGALQPSSSILFEWAHAPASGSSDTRCLSPETCALLLAQAMGNATSAGSLPAPAAPPAPPALPGLPALPGDGLGDARPCGWAAAQGLPCIGPVVYTWVGVVGSAALVGGTTLYTTCFQSWSYRRMIAASQFTLLLVNLLDNVWIARLNVAIGLPDELFIFSDSMIATIVSRLNTMPFLIYAAKLCPPSVEASMFALFMGLSNFGSAAGNYAGSALLRLFGGVEAPNFEHLAQYVLTRTLLGVLPIALVPILVPRGTPLDTALEMGAAKAVMEDCPLVSTEASDGVELKSSGRSHAKPRGITECSNVVLTTDATEGV